MGRVFYYPPCKCNLANEVRHYDPKRREFYYHSAYLLPSRLRQQQQKPDHQINQFDGGGGGGGGDAALPIDDVYFDPYSNQFIVSSDYYKYFVT